MSTLKVIISGGGTGGHIYPAIAIADALKEIDSSIDILFVGAEGKMEMEKVPKAGYKIIGLWISGLQRKLTLRNLSFPFKLIHSWFKARQIIREFKPHVVVGVGGYASGPMMQAAAAKGIPTLIQEQNGYAGLTNKMLADKVKKVCVAYHDMDKYFPKEKILFTGNPVRKDIQDLAAIRLAAYAHFTLASDKKTLLILGGSLGARTINDSLKNGVEKVLAAGYQVIWQTGKFYFDEMTAAFKGKENDRLIMKAFITRMDYAYACADVVISRAGALSISELCLAEKPSILVPSPNVAEDHQTKNAMALVKENAAILVKDKEAQACLMDEAIQLLENEEKQAALASQIKQLAKPNAAMDIANEVMRLGSVG
ncbi:MAG: undecaprenyldiphospho-muramoylpentapeptide beta-N-acetylglucosaminyltransferase [Flammeovirgaceae bacterium]